MAQLSNPVTLPHPCDLTVWFLLWGKLHDHNGGHLSTGKHVYFYGREVRVSGTHTQSLLFSKKVHISHILQFLSLFRINSVHTI